MEDFIGQDLNLDVINVNCSSMPLQGEENIIIITYRLAHSIFKNFCFMISRLYFWSPYFPKYVTCLPTSTSLITYFCDIIITCYWFSYYRYFEEFLFNSSLLLFSCFYILKYNCVSTPFFIHFLGCVANSK